MRKTTMLILLLLPVCLKAQNYDFATKLGGNTLYFKITSTGGQTGPPAATSLLKVVTRHSTYLLKLVVE